MPGAPVRVATYSGVNPSHEATPEPAAQQRLDHAPLRSAVIVNPNRVEGLDELRRTIEDQLADAGWPAPAWLETTAEDPGTGQARQAVEDGAEVVFVSGGDGTVRACIEGLVGTEAALAVLPGGTGNLLATNLGIPPSPEDGIRLALDRGRRAVDVGEVDGQAFAVMAGMGLDAAMMQDAPTALKAKAGALAYVISAFKHLADDEMKVEVRVDDRPVLRRRARSVLVGNVGKLQAGVDLLPDAVPDNGQLDVAILAPRNLGHWVQLLVGVLRGRRRVPNMEVLRGSRISVISDRPQPRQLDGDVIEPSKKLEVSVRAGALWVCVYQPDTSDDIAEGAPAGG
ncbi:diacylglycerol kinase (ATP) [Oerskovia enterophila]